MVMKMNDISEPNIDYQQIDLVELLQAVAQKNRTAFEQLYDETVQQIYNLAYRITQQSEMAEEVVNDVYLQIWQQAGRFDAKRGTVLAWMIITCRTRALDALRRQKPARQNRTLDSVEQQTDHTQPLQDLVSATENHDLIYNVLQQLDNEQRQLLALAFFRDYSHQELSEFTNIPLGTVKSKLRRTLSTLQQLINSYHPSGQVL